MARLVLKDIDAETAEKLELRAKRLGTTPEEEASQLLRERLLAEPHRDVVMAGGAPKTPAIVALANALDPKIAGELKALETELAALKAAQVEFQEEKNSQEHLEIEQPLPDPRFVEKHGYLVFMGAATTGEIPDHRLLRDERIDSLLRGIDEGRV